ncbi:Leucine-rich repeat and IQ domain-containing protein 1-like [Oopsacas minuta]|uniref:Leucine-rich repeat and IQ domain-containing protein 1-like n=1 Tax=Oopsacas minuta TaxID=111878 RepID=A0AAV7JCW7_9METZ|nr:Leucine-rich repeat and IQ domain-containing protein 1-like [Oopsacas minuta]
MKKYGGKGRALPVHEIKKFGRQIIEAIIFLKERGFILGHIHAGNVLLQADVCKLTDLENSLLGLSYHSRYHTLNIRKIQNSESEAVYNIGRLLYEMTFGETLRAGAIESMPPTTPPQIRTLLEELITLTACKNGMPMLAQLLKHSHLPSFFVLIFQLFGKLLKMSKTQNPFLWALKRLKDTFIATSNETDQLVREAEIICKPSVYDQKLEKKLNLCLENDNSQILLDQAKEEIETFSLALHKVDNSETVENASPIQHVINSTSAILKDTAELVPCDTRPESHVLSLVNNVTTGSPTEEPFQNSNVSHDRPAISLSEVISSPHLDLDNCQLSVANESINTDISNPQYISNKDTSPNSFTYDDNPMSLTEELDKLRERFIEERESIINARTAFQHNLYSSATTKIQTQWRGYQMYKLYYPQIRNKYHLKIRCIIKLQSFYRRSIALRLFRNLVRDRSRNTASVVIQNWWRVCMAKNVHKKLIQANELKKHRSAVLIQSLWRMYQCRITYFKLLSQRHRIIDATIIIQTLWRGNVARKMYSMLLLKTRKQEFHNNTLEESVQSASPSVTQSQDINCSIVQEMNTRDIDTVASNTTREDSIDSSRVELCESLGKVSPTQQELLSPGQMHPKSIINRSHTNMHNTSQEIAIPLDMDIIPASISIPSLPEEDINPHRILLLLEELRLNWLKVHSLWKDSSLSPIRSKNIPADPIPTHYKPLSHSHLTDYSSVNTPLHQITRVVVNEVKYPVDLSCLVKVPNLLTLSLCHCPAVSLEGIQHVPNLTHISLQHCGLTTFNLKGLHNIYYIDLSHNRVSVLKSIVKNSRVIECVMNCNRLVHFGEIIRFVNLQKLFVDKNLLVRGDGLQNLRSLVELSCTHNHLSEIPQTSFSPLLQTVDLSGNNLKTVSMLYHPLLSVLRLDDNNITDLEPLQQAYLPSLQILTLNGNSIYILVNLSALVMLERLEIKFNYLDNLNSLLDCLRENYRLNILELDGNPVTQEIEYRESIQRQIPCLEKLDSWEITLASDMKGNMYNIPRNDFIEMIDRQIEERNTLQTKQLITITELENYLFKNSDSIRNLLNTRIQHSRETYKLAVHHLREHEYYGTGEAEVLLKNESTHDITYSILVIQSYTRGYLARLSYRNISKSAVVIQKYLRGNYVRKRYNIRLKEVKTAVLVIQAYFKGWWVRSRLSEALRSLEDMNDSDGDDIEQLCVATWGDKPISGACIELPKTPIGFYDEIMESYTRVNPNQSNCSANGLTLPNIQTPIHRDLSDTDRNLRMAWPSRNSSNTTVASNRTDNLTNESSCSSIQQHDSSDKIKELNDPWFLNNEQSIALFNKRAKKFKQGKKKKDERNIFQDPLKRLEKLQTGSKSNSNSIKKRVTPIPSRLSSCSLSSHNSSIDLIFKWSNTNQKSERDKIKSENTSKGNFLPKIPSRIRAGNSPQLMSDIDSP